MTTPEHKTFEFGPFLLDTTERVLLRDGRPVPLTLKAFEVLLLLVENSGHIVEKDQLMNRVWAGSFVEEGNLKVTVSRLRKALEDRNGGARYIETVPRRGYRFLAGVNSAEAEHLDLVLTERTRETVTLDRAGIVTDRDQSRRLPFLLAGALLILLGIVGGFLLLRNRTSSVAPTVSAAPIKTIAVLPFKPIVADSRNESLEAGMADTLITRLNGLKEIEVRPMSAVRKYAGLEQDAVAAGREQRVDAVLDGSLQRSGDRLRVTVRLVRVADGQTLWTERFEQNFTEIFLVQDSVAERVAAALAVRLTGEQREVLVKRYTNNTQAYELFIKGVYSGSTEEERKKRIEYFQQAIGLDPGYALAYAAMANSYIMLGWSLSPHETFPRAAAAARKALELDETISDAHRALGSYKLNYEWNWPEAEREFKRAMELDPNNDGAYSEYASYLITIGRFDEAIALRKRANDLAGPSAFPVITGLGHAYHYARRYEEAVRHYQRALELNPRFGRAHVAIGMVYVQLGKYEEAITAIKQAISLRDEIRNIAALGYACAVAGKRAEARKVLEDLGEISKRKYVSSYFMAGIFAALGELDQAFAWLEKAFAERDPSLTLIRVDPVFDPIRSDPRFATLLRRVGLPS